ncbi:MAG: arginase family protein [Deltaproteobacteria bacterium]|nr:arginase family protein [Deltaproteobacteria bacterium]
MTQLPALDYVRSGTQGFFRLPFLRPDGAHLSDALAGKDCRAVLLGVPFDGGATIQAGARHGPAAARAASALLPGYCPHARLDVFATLKAKDGGNVCASPFSLPLTHEAIEAEVGAIASSAATPFLVGGDHSITLPALRARARYCGPLALVHFDAHSDTSSGALWGTPAHHGTWLRQAIEEGLVEKGALVQIGLRGPHKDGDEHDIARAHGACIVTSDDVIDRGWRHAVSQVWRRCEGKPLWVSFDVDAIDPAHAPGTGTTVPGGLSSREARALLRGLRDLHLVGMDVVELCPPLDAKEMTAQLVAHLLFEGLSVAASRVRASTSTTG